MPKSLLIIDIAEENLEICIQVCRTEIPKILNESPAATQITLNIWLIDIHKGLLELSKVVALCQQYGTFCFVAYSDRIENNPISFSSLFTSDKLKTKLKMNS